MDIFNTREIAIALWAAFLAIAVLTVRDVRATLVRLIGVSLHWKISVPIFALAAYVAVVVIVLDRVGLWNLGLLKDTIYWFLFVGLVLFGKSATHDTPSAYWKTTAKDQITVLVLLTFIVNTYTFSLPVELALVPVALMIGLLGAVAEMKEEHASAARLLSGIQAFFGFLILALAVIRAVGDYRTLASVATLHKISLPFVLTLSSLPFMYLVTLYALYDRVWVWTSFNQPPHLTKYMRKRILQYGRLRLSRVSRLATIKPYEIMRVRSYSDFDELLAGYATRVHQRLDE